MSISSILFLVIFAAIISLLIIAFKKKWIGSVSGGIFTSQVIMHDWATKDKQGAMEYVIENQEDQNQRNGESSEGREGGATFNEQ